MKITLWGPAPPPTHGVSISFDSFSKYCKENLKLNTKIVKTSPDRQSFEFQGVTAKNILLAAKLILAAFYDAAVRRPDKVYLTCATKGAALYRDLFITLTYSLFRKKINIHIQGTEFSLTSGIKKKLIKNIYKKHNLIFVSPNLKSSHEFLCTEKNYKIVPNGCKDYHNETSWTHRTNNFGTTPVKLLFLSNLDEAKGVQAFLQTANEIKSRGLIFTAKMCGNFTKKYNKKSLAIEIEKRGLTDVIDIIGPVHGRSKEKAINESHYLIFPSEKESFGNVIIEGMSAGLFVISSNTTSAKYILDNKSGIVLEKDFPSECAEIIINMNIEKYKSVTQNARSRYITLFTQKKYVESLYKAIS